MSLIIIVCILSQLLTSISKLPYYDLERQVEYDLRLSISIIFLCHLIFLLTLKKLKNFSYCHPLVQINKQSIKQLCEGVSSEIFFVINFQKVSVIQVSKCSVRHLFDGAICESRYKELIKVNI